MRGYPALLGSVWDAVGTSGEVAAELTAARQIICCKETVDRRVWGAVYPQSSQEDKGSAVHV